jgi:hypothetical protein
MFDTYQCVGYRYMQLHSINLLKLLPVWRSMAVSVLHGVSFALSHFGKKMTVVELITNDKHVLPIW